MLKIFLLSADPKEGSPLNVDVESNQINEVYRLSNYREDFSIESTTATNYDNLLDVLMRNEASIIHFSGHGVGEEGLVLVDKKGEKNILKTQTLTQLIDVLQSENQHIQCVFLNGCYTEIQAQAISSSVEYVIGMSDQVFDDDAVKFAKYFYKGLFEKKSIETSFKLGCISIDHSMSIVDYDQNTKRAVYDPAPGDQKASQPVINNKNPQLIVNKKFQQLISEQKQVIPDEQWEDFEKILSTIDFDFVKKICRETLRQDIKDIEREISPIKNLVDLKHILLKSYPTHKDKDTLTILDFAERLIKEEDISEKEQQEIKKWLEKIAEKKINLPIGSKVKDLGKNPITVQKSIPKKIQNFIGRLFNRKSENKVPSSHLLLSLIPNTGLREQFSLQAEFIDNYHQGQTNYQPKPVEYKAKGIVDIEDISPKAIESYLSELIDEALDQFSIDNNPIIELFLPYEYLGEPYDQCQIRYGVKRKNKYIDLGVEYQFNLRCIDRYEERKVFIAHHKIWEQIKNKFDHDSLCLVKKIEEDLNDFFDTFTDTGTPIAIWTRTSPNNIYRINGDKYTKTLLQEEIKELMKINSIENLSQITKKVYEQRQKDYEQRQKDFEQRPKIDNEDYVEKKYLGYYLGLIFDNPELVPSIYLNKYYYQGTN